MPIIGAHVSTVGGFARAVERGVAMGADAIQIFGASPRQWAARMPSREDVISFREAFERSGILNLFLHASYLANVAAPEEMAVNRSIDSLAAHLAIAEALGADGLIFHVGSTKGLIQKEKALAQIAAAMHKVLKLSPGKAKLIMENGSGGGGKIGSEPADLRSLHDMVASQRIGVCIDTAHAFGAGIFDLDQWHKELGLERVTAIHANDSKAPFGSLKDRHQNIGEGEIGKKGLCEWGKNSYLKKLPWILEVPGFDNEGPDKKNVDILKSYFA